MLAVHSQKNANYLHILGVLRYLRDEKLISEAQYLRAKNYYRKLTGADITVRQWNMDDIVVKA